MLFYTEVFTLFPQPPPVYAGILPLRKFPAFHFVLLFKTIQTVQKKAMFSIPRSVHFPGHLTSRENYVHTVPPGNST